MKACVTIQLFLVVLCTLASARAVPGEELDHPLFNAIRTRDDRRVARLLREGTPARLKDEDGNTTLMVAALWGTVDCVRLLLERGADVDASSSRGTTALHWAAGDFEKTRLLVEAGADVHAQDAEGKTALMFAASHLQNDATIEYLVQRGAELERRDRAGQTAFQRAVDRASPETVKRLAENLSTRGKLDQFRDRDWLEFVVNASARGDIQILETLHGLLPDKDLLDAALEDGGDEPRPIHVALVSQRPETARWLLEHGVDADRETAEAVVAPLILSTFFESGDASIARALLERGADPTACSESGETALTWARRRGNGELVNLLVKAGVPEHPDEPPAVPERDLTIHAGNQKRMIGEAVEKSVALMLRSSDVFLKERSGCVSCHHQFFPAIAASQARERGLGVDEAAILLLTRRHEAAWNERLPQTHTQETPLPFLAGNGMGLWSLSALGYPRNLLTDAFVRQFLEQQLPDGSWPTRVTRPPMTGDDVQLVALAIRALRDYPLPGRDCDVERTIRRASDWLRDRKARQPDEHVYRLLGLVWAGEDEESWKEDAETLLASQLSDGGWAQFEGLAADAWATGHALVALATAGAIQPRDPVYRRGVEFLLRTQFDDGSWFVQRRAVPFQVPFDSGFPFGKDQWISITGTAWAVMALVRAIEPGSPGVVTARSNWLLHATEQAGTDSYGEGSSSDDSAAAYGSEGQESDESQVESATTEPPKTLEREIIFEKDVAPILSRSCVKCHSGTLPEGELDITRREFLLRGGSSGKPAIVPGRSAESRLLRVVTSRRRSFQMPPAKKRDEFPGLNENEIAIIHTWIEQGAKWPEGAKISR